MEALHTALGGVPYTDVDDAAARMAAIEHWPMGGEARLCESAECMRHADPPKDLLQRWKDEGGFLHGEIEDILNLSDPPWHTAYPGPLPGAFVGTPTAEFTIRKIPIAADRSLSMSAEARSILSPERMAPLPRYRIWPSCRRFSRTPSLAVSSWTASSAPA